MPDLFFSSALLPSGWARDVRMAIGGDGVIAAVATDADGKDAEWVRGIAVPGVPNLHSHAFQRAMAGLVERSSPGGESDTLWTWRERMYGFLARLDPDDVEAVARQLFVELLRHGYTSVAEFHYLRNDVDGRPYHDPLEMARRILGAAAETGIGITLLPVVYRTADFGGAPLDPTQRRFAATTEDLLGDIHLLRTVTSDDPDVRVGLALHSLRAVPREDLAAAVEGLDRMDSTAPVHIHVAEQVREVEACLAWSGARPVRWLLDHAPVDARWCLVHATHVDDGETRALAASGAVVGLCPTTEANLGDGIFPFAEYQSAGGRWGVGTDSHVSVSPVADLRMLEYGQRLARRLRSVAAGHPYPASTGRTLLTGAWAGGARALGRPTGSLEEGARADLVVLDPEHTAVVGREEDDLLDGWIFNGEDSPVRHVMVGGRWVVLDGHHPREDEAARAYRAAAHRLTGR